MKKKGVTSTTLTIRLPVAFKRRLELAAQASFRSITEYVHRAVSMQMDRDTEALPQKKERT